MKTIYSLLILVCFYGCQENTNIRDDKYDLSNTTRKIGDNLYPVSIQSGLSYDILKLRESWHKEARAACNNRPYKTFITSDAPLEHKYTLPIIRIYVVENGKEIVNQEVGLSGPTLKTHPILGYALCSPDENQLANDSVCYIDDSDAIYLSDFYFDAATAYYEKGDMPAALKCYELSMEDSNFKTEHSSESAFMTWIHV